MVAGSTPEAPWARLASFRASISRAIAGGDGSPDRFTAELYDLEADPYDLRNLIADPAHAEQRRHLEQLFEEVSREAGSDRMPVYEGIVHVRPKY